MALGKDYATQECSIARALEVIGERWTLLVIRDALYGVRRYNDFLVHLGIPRAVLAARLQALTADGILEKRRYQESPPRDEYVLTDRGIELWPTIRSLGLWGREHFTGTPGCATSGTPTAVPNSGRTANARPAESSYPSGMSSWNRAPDSTRTRRTRSAARCSSRGGCCSRSRRRRRNGPGCSGPPYQLLPLQGM